MTKSFDITVKCTGCGVCISACPEKAIEFFTVEYVKKARILKDRCIKCGNCAGVCGFKAVSSDSVV